MEFIISSHIKAHPMALARLDDVASAADRDEIRALLAGYDGPTHCFVEKPADGITGIAAPLCPNPVIVRLSDFKTNEYAALVGGQQFEPTEENPMLGWRGASRYYDDGYPDGFDLECQALRKVREEMGFDNVIVMIPFCQRSSRRLFDRKQRPDPAGAGDRSGRRHRSSGLRFSPYRPTGRG